MMMMKSVFWWRKPEYPEETNDLRQVTYGTFHTHKDLTVVDGGGGLTVNPYNVYTDPLTKTDPLTRSRVSCVCKSPMTRLPSWS